MLETVFNFKQGSKSIKFFKLSINLKSNKPNIEMLEGYPTPEGDYLIPSLNTKFTLKEFESSYGIIWYETIYIDGKITILISDKIKKGQNEVPASTFPNEKLTSIFTGITIVVLKTLLHDLEIVYNETHSVDIGKEINHLVNIYKTYIV